jgi:hypothetical protein
MSSAWSSTAAIAPVRPGSTAMWIIWCFLVGYLAYELIGSEAVLSGRSRRSPHGWVKSQAMGETIRDHIERRRDRIKIVVVPLLLAAVCIFHHKWAPPWTRLDSIGLAAGLLGTLVYVAYVGNVRCPRCRRFISLRNILPFQNKPQPERCAHCGLNFGKPMDKPAGH